MRDYERRAQGTSSFCGGDITANVRKGDQAYRGWGVVAKRRVVILYLVGTPKGKKTREGGAAETA